MKPPITRRQLLQGMLAGAALSVTAPWSTRVVNARVSGKVDQYEADVANTFADVTLELIRSTPGFTPPVASRAIGLFGLTLYEAMVPGMRGYRSLSGRLAGFPKLPTLPRASFHWPTVANACLAEILRQIFPESSPRFGDISKTERSLENGFSFVPAPVRRRSRKRGEAIATAIHDWSMTDGGHQGHLTNFPSGYAPPVGPGLWEPTPPGFEPIPLQPFWGQNRPFVAKFCDALPPPPFSTDPSSNFYAFALEVYETVNNLTPDQEMIALFWADNPGTVTPPGHSISILRHVLTTEHSSLATAAEAYLRVGCALADAFIQCWAVKYQWNLLRPVTYIRTHIDPDWTSPVITPPFPEYSSGHSTQSGAWAEVMTAMFGAGYHFTDHTHDASGFSPRSYTSFREAAREAAVSRLYGGIHYHFGNEAGLIAGRCVGHAAATIPLRAD